MPINSVGHKEVGFGGRKEDNSPNQAFAKSSSRENIRLSSQSLR